jgi:Amt family ammonium transporter
MVGALLTGVFADASLGGTNGLLYGNPAQLLAQVLSVLAVFAYSAASTVVILKGIALVIPLRVSDRQERQGLDIVNHGEEAYSTGEGALLLLNDEVPGVFEVGAIDPDHDAPSRISA